MMSFCHVIQDIRNLDNISFTDWFKSHGGSTQSIKRMWDPIGEWQLHICNLSTH